MQARRQKLRDALRLQQFYRDVEDEEDWIREKEPIAASANRGQYIAFLVVIVCSLTFILSMPATLWYVDDHIVQTFHSP